MLRTGVIWKSGWCCITSRSGWLLELLTELTSNNNQLYNYFTLEDLIIFLTKKSIVSLSLFKALDMWGQIQRDFGKNCLEYLWPINVAVLDINTTNETKLSFYILQRQSSSKDAITKMIWEKIFILRGKMEKNLSLHLVYFHPFFPSILSDCIQFPSLFVFIQFHKISYILSKLIC